MKITENAKLRIALTVLLSCLLVAGVVLWCVAYFWKDNSTLDAEPGVRIEVESDDGVNIEVSSEPQYGISFLDGAWQEAYSITASWTAENYDSSFVDIAGYSWSAKYASTNLQGGCSYSEDASRATDFGGDVWNEEGQEYYSYVSFGEFSGGSSYTIFYDDPLVAGYDSDEDFYTPGDMASDTVKVDSLAAYIWEPFGTPIELTFTLWDYSGNDPLTATVRFDYMSYYTADSFTFYSGEKFDDSSEVLFSASYDLTAKSFSGMEIPGSNAGNTSISDVQSLMTPSLEKAQEAENPALWYKAEGSSWSVGTVSEASYNEETMSGWSIELSYEQNTYTEVSSANIQGSQGSISWDTISDNILGTTGGIPEKTGGAVTKKNLQTFDKALNNDAQAMITVKFVYNSDARLEFGLSFDEYGNLSVGIVGATTNVDGEIIFNGGV